MGSKWAGWLELLVALVLVLGWGVLELVGLRMDKRREQQAQREDSRSEPPA